LLTKRPIVMRKNLVLLTNGNGSNVQDLVHMINATTEGTAGFETIAGVPAPKIGTIGENTYFTSVKFPTADLGLTAGQDVSIVVVTKTPWAGNDSAGHCLFDKASAAGSANRLNIFKEYNNKLYFQTRDAGSEVYCKILAVDDNNWASDTTHFVIMTRDSSNNVIRGYLDGVEADEQAGTPRAESAGDTACIGTLYDDSYSLNAPILVAIFDRVLSGDEIDILSSMTQFPTRSIRIG